MSRLSFRRKMKSLAIVTTGGLGAYGLIAFFKGEETFYKNVVMPLVHLVVEPEQAHRLAVGALKHRIFPRSRYADPDCLKVSIFGKELPNPIGLAAGFDKNAEAVSGLFDVGFGFVEVGSVTPKPQPGNDKPRVFRLSQDLAVINRYGFNNDGHVQVLERLSQIRESGKPAPGLIGVNLGKNKTSEFPIEDYVEGIRRFAGVADYLVINVSSPNTPGLRSMQNKKVLTELLQAVISARDSLSSQNDKNKNKPPILLKLAPDLTSEERKDIADVILQKRCKVDGLIICNTTTARPESLSSSANKHETGGLSGRPLKDVSTKMIAEMYKLTKGSVPIIGVGGVSSGQDAFDKIRAGACVVQVYTGLVYEGPPIVTRIKKELVQILRENNFSNVSEAVGKGFADFL